MTGRRPIWGRLAKLGSLLAAVLWAAATPLRAQEPAPAAIDSIFAAWDSPVSPGCAVGVSRAGDLVFSGAWGSANLESGELLTPDRVFYLASVSKQFTATAVALLVLDGMLSLDDDVRTWIPELPDYGAPITLRHLLTHTSGLRDYLTLMALAGLSLQDAHSRDEILALIARQRALNFPPGERYLYSNTGYFLIPIVVERVTGRTIRAFMDDRVFRPLGMAHTLFFDDHREAIPNRALSYGGGEDGTFERTFLDQFDQVGSGGVLSTVEDLARWDANFYTSAVGGRPLLDLLHARGVVASGDTIDYALGLSLGEYLGERTVEHGGSMMGFRTNFLRFPERRLAVITLCNLGSIDPALRSRQVADLYLAREFRAYRDQFAGRYVSDELPRIADVVLDGRTLRVVPQDEPQDPLDLQYAGPDRFETRGGPTVSFTRDADGRVSGFVLDAGRAMGIAFRRP
jgi:CubicO group peptidase (beta-lactamase class C family)